jgi:hypothetical protein
MVVTSPLVIVLLAAGVSYQEPSKAPAWTTVTSRDGEFRIDFPSRPHEQARPVPSRVGTIEQRTYQVRAGGCLYIVRRDRYPRPFPLLGLADWLAEQKRGYLPGQVELVRDHNVPVGHVTGEQFEYKGPSPRVNGTVTGLTRHFIKGSSYYALTVISGPNQPLSPDADRFLDSFRFTASDADRAGAAPKSDATAKSDARPKDRPGEAAKTPASGARSRLKDDTPEDALHGFLVAFVEQDEAALRAITLPDPELEWLARGLRPPANALEMMRTYAMELKTRRLKPGESVALPEGQPITVRPEDVTEDRAVLLPEGDLLPIKLRRVEGHWKVDARPIIVARKAAAAAQQNPTAQ